MTVDAPRHAFTVDEYHRMAEAGIFGEDDRVELIEGEVFEMAAIGSRHAGCVNLLNRFFVQRLGDRGVVTVQNPVRLGDLSEPEPDLALLRPRDDFYAEAHPTARDVLLVVEVSDSSHRYDESVKLPLYARHEVPEVWRIDLEDGAVTVHREPAGGAYRSATTHGPGDTLVPAAFPDLKIPAGDLLGR
ncbi:MAG: Uma2 family endonuclease [Thermoanaerobaculia bacterium]